MMYRKVSDLCENMTTNQGKISVLIDLVSLHEKSRTYKEKEKKLMLIGILIPVIINSFTEFGIFGETNYGILFYQLLIFYISISANPNLTPRELISLKVKRPDIVQKFIRARVWAIVCFPWFY